MLPVVLQFASGEVRNIWCKLMLTKPSYFVTLQQFFALLELDRQTDREFFPITFSVQS